MCTKYYSGDKVSDTRRLMARMGKIRDPWIILIGKPAEHVLLRSLLRLAGHVACMDELKQFFFLFCGENVTSFLSTNSSMARNFPRANRWWGRSAKRFLLCLLSEGSLLWSQKPYVIFWSRPTQFMAKCNVSNTNRNSDTHMHLQMFLNLLMALDFLWNR
jgi:hypothetical protein